MMSRGIVIILALLCPTWISDAQTIRVGEGQAFATVTEGIAAAADGDTVMVMAGHYAEQPILIDKSIALIGVDKPILDGESEREILLVEADSVTIRGLVFQNVGVSFVDDRAAIKVNEAEGCQIVDNILRDNFFGIYLAQSAGCLIAGNHITASGPRESGSANGIHLWYSTDTYIADNYVEGHRDGIYLEFVEDTKVERNTTTRNLRYGLHFMFSDRNEYNHNIFRNNQAGVAVMYTKNMIMDGNTFDNNWGNASFGLLLKDITDSQVTNNTFSLNTTAIHVEGSDRIDFDYNTFRQNGWAMKVMANSYDNRIRYNTVEGNTFDIATNSRNTSVEIDGNYWDAYNGYDLDQDGVGDVPFHPVRLFSLVVENNEAALFLLRSFFVTALDAAEKVLPALTPANLVDNNPRMTREHSRD